MQHSNHKDALSQFKDLLQNAEKVKERVFLGEVENVWVKKINKETHMYKVAVWMRSADFYFRLFTKTISFFRHCEYGS